MAKTDVELANLDSADLIKSVDDALNRAKDIYDRACQRDEPGLRSNILPIMSTLRSVRKVLAS